MPGTIRPELFRICTILENRANPDTRRKDTWGIALDIGYSSTKVFSPNSIICFPSYTKKTVYGKADQTVAKLSGDSIFYRDDEKKEEYYVGQLALDNGTATDSSIASHFSNERHNTGEYLILARVGIALASMENQFGSPKDKPIYLESGFPPEFLEDSRAEFAGKISGWHEFSIKVGNSPWREVKFNIDPVRIDVIAQPLGSLFSLIANKGGGMVYEAEKYLKSNLLVFDPGFGTLDTYSIKNSMVHDSKTFEELSMRVVFEKTLEYARASNERKTGNETITAKNVHDVCRSLKRGVFDITDKSRRYKGKVNIGPYLERASHEVCLKALNEIDQNYNYLFDFDYLLVTGGTGAAWINMIRNTYGKMESLKILTANQNDPSVMPVFGNVRGYYIYQLLKLKNI